MIVKAVRDGYYGDVFRKAGDSAPFQLASLKDFSDSKSPDYEGWMEIVEASPEELKWLEEAKKKSPRVANAPKDALPAEPPKVKKGSAPKGDKPAAAPKGDKPAGEPTGKKSVI